MMIVRIAVRSPAMLAFSLVAAFSINPRLSIVFLCVIPFGRRLYLVIRNAHPIFVRIFQTYDKAHQVVQEMCVGFGSSNLCPGRT
jgi:ATP-binding cassette subfamily B protein